VGARHHAFRLNDEDGDKIQRSKRHAGAGKSPTQHLLWLLIAWFQSPDGCISPGSTEDSLVYSTDTPYTEIQLIRAVLMSFCCSCCRKASKGSTTSGRGFHVTMKIKTTHRVESPKHPSFHHRADTLNLVVMRFEGRQSARMRGFKR
jgi:hypothetical protein